MVPADQMDLLALLDDASERGAVAAGEPLPGPGATLQRWENTTRWYEAELACDLLGDLVVWRRWGGLGTRRGGEMTCVAASPAEGVALIERIGRVRLHRKDPYRPVAARASPVAIFSSTARPSPSSTAANQVCFSRRAPARSH